MGNSRKETEGFRFWKQGSWNQWQHGACRGPTDADSGIADIVQYYDCGTVASLYDCQWYVHLAGSAAFGMMYEHTTQQCQVLGLQADLANVSGDFATGCTNGGGSATSIDHSTYNRNSDWHAITLCASCWRIIYEV